jgi:orotate phosphoribosyltransferase
MNSHDAPPYGGDAAPSYAGGSSSSTAVVSPAAARLIELSLAAKVLLFGTFTLKSGRISPWFFNAGLLYQGSHLSALASAFATAILASGLEYDILFGPAYKGIALAAITALELSRQPGGKDVTFAYNRKEAKDHGEGGNLVGAPLQGKRVLVLDDVITAGTAIRESAALIAAAGGKVVGIVEVLDRQERGKGSTSTVQEVEKELGVPVITVLNLDNILVYLRAQGGFDKQLAAMEACACWRSCIRHDVADVAHR